ncbi:hypothetical protein DFH06DRAFT_1143731 [Mycena polygramma]|nr:hypothetical protein DFH06DRAFT_1143731 [Mycena polygramma]
MYGSATARPGARFKLDTIPRRETVQLSASLHRFGSQSNVQKDGAKRMWLNSISEWAIAKILLMSVWPLRNWKRGTYLGMGNGDYAVQLPTYHQGFVAQFGGQISPIKKNTDSSASGPREASLGPCICEHRVD